MDCLNKRVKKIDKWNLIFNYFLFYHWFCINLTIIMMELNSFVYQWLKLGLFYNLSPYDWETLTYSSLNYKFADFINFTYFCLKSIDSTIYFILQPIISSHHTSKLKKTSFVSPKNDGLHLIWLGFRILAVNPINLVNKIVCRMIF